MSSLLALQTKDVIVFASDTALSASYKNTTFRVGNDETKLFDYPNFIMFASGNKIIRDIFISSLSISPSVEEIASILLTDIVKYCNPYDLEIVIAMKDLSRIVFLSSVDNFDYRENISTNGDTQLFTAGVKTKEVAELFEVNFEKLPLLESLEKTYKTISCDEIGGYLDIFYLSKNKITKKQIKIDNKKECNDEDIYNSTLHLVFAERLFGKVILGNKLYIEDALGVVEVQSGAIKIYDNNKNIKVQIGRYPNPDNESQFKYGMRIWDGSLDFRTTSTPNRGTQIDGTGIRTFNSNSVRTFNVEASTGLVEIVGSLSIRTSTNSNRGVVIDGNGIKGYNASGQTKFEINSNTGDAWFGGRLEYVTGTLDQVSGTVNNLGGSFAGTLNGVDGTFTGNLSAATGTFNGLVTGSLSSQTIDAIRIDADQINALRITADMIDVTDLSAISANIGNITAGTINTVSLMGVNIDTTQDIRVGRNIQLQGSGTNSIRFSSNSFISSAGGGNLNIEAFNDLNITASTTIFNGRVDFSNATVTGI